MSNPPKSTTLGALRASGYRARTVREEGWITVAALAPTAEWADAARRLECAYVLEGGEPRPGDAAGGRMGGLSGASPWIGISSQ